MITIQNYLNDGANWQAQAVLAYLRGNINDIINDTYDEISGEYRADINVGRYENCREQGYAFMLNCDFKRVANFVVYEHRCSDRICVIFNDKFTINTPTWTDMFEDRDNGYEIDIDFNRGQIKECAEWIINKMKNLLDEFISMA